MGKLINRENSNSLLLIDTQIDNFSYTRLLKVSNFLMLVIISK